MVNANLVAAAIAHVEGFYSTKSQAFIHKNPGNLRDDSGAYATFGSIGAGWSHLVECILNYPKLSRPIQRSERSACCSSLS